LISSAVAAHWNRAHIVLGVLAKLQERHPLIAGTKYRSKQLHLRKQGQWAQHPARLCRSTVNHGQIGEGMAGFVRSIVGAVSTVYLRPLAAKWVWHWLEAFHELQLMSTADSRRPP
jgi:hypothetical protein